MTTKQKLEEGILEIIGRHFFVNEMEKKEKLELRSEIKSFISQALSDQKEEIRELIKGMKQSDIKEHHEKFYSECPRCVEIIAVNKALNDILAELSR